MLKERKRQWEEEEELAFFTAERLHLAVIRMTFLSPDTHQDWWMVLQCGIQNPHGPDLGVPAELHCEPP